MPKPAPLQLLADEMRAVAALKPFAGTGDVQVYRRKIAGGAVLEYLLDEATREWSFAIAACKYYPTVQEIRYFRHVFAVPSGAWEKRYKRGELHVVRFRWDVNLQVSPKVQKILANANQLDEEIASSQGE